MSVRIDLTFDEIDLVSTAVCRDRDRLLDEAFGNRGTCLISDHEQEHVPVHQEILRKIETALTDQASSDASPNDVIDSIVGADQHVLAGASFDKTRELCQAFSLDALHVVIDVHRANCRQADCPVLTVMVATAEARS